MMSSTDQSMKKWYVIQVFTSQEKKVKKSLEKHLDSSPIGELIEEIVIPTENVMEVKKGEQKVTEKKIWPGYVLIRMELNDQSWKYVKEVNGVIDFLGGEQPTSLGEKEVNDLLNDLRSKEGSVTQKHQFQVGDKVKINEGVFVNFIGTVAEVFHDKGKLNVMVSIFGRDTRVNDLEFWQVEEVSDQES